MCAVCAGSGRWTTQNSQNRSRHPPYLHSPLTKSRHIAGSIAVWQPRGAAGSAPGAKNGGSAALIATSTRPAYQNALRAIGRYFDRNYRHVLLCEVGDGYIARAFPGQQGNLTAEGIALPMGDVTALISSQEQARGVVAGAVKMPPLCPTG
jgi:hypothetical protein